MVRKRGTESLLNAEQIIRVAIDLVDEQGLDALTMRALADRLDVFPTAVTWHVGSKSRLLALAVSELFRGQSVDVPEGASWQTTLDMVAHSTRRALHAHPNFASVVASVIVIDPVATRPFVELVLDALRRAGWEKEGLVDAMNTFVGSITGWLCLELAAEPPASAKEVDWRERFQRELQEVDAEKFPNVSLEMPLLMNRAFMHRWESGQTQPLDRSYAMLVRTLIDGLERAPGNSEEPQALRSRPAFGL